MPDRAPMDQIIKLAIMAVGGQGGGVLTNWIVDLAEANGWHAQSTAVAGVAQRTGATIYYVEMAPDAGRTPVFALAPAPGDVDVLIAAEWMEAGRAVMRGFVTPDRTTIIASTHRALAVAEKIAPGDGLASHAEVAAALDVAAARVIAFDMQRPAVASGSVISATLFGALAGSGTLPFDRESFEETIRRSGRGVEQSLAAFRAGHDGPGSRPVGIDSPTTSVARGPRSERTAYEALDARVAALPQRVWEIARLGLRKVVDYQDADYGAEYLDRVEAIAALDAGDDARLTWSAAKFIANAMAYDDVIRVADLKTRSARLRRVRAEMGIKDQEMHVTEFMHPRIEEVIATLPVRWGLWIRSQPRFMAWLDRRINRGRRLRSDTITGFLMLYLVAGLRPRRRTTLRHEEETRHIGEWLDRAREAAARDYDLAVEILATRRLVKGYSDTHVRGLSKFDRVLGALVLLEGRDDAADWLRRLRDAALQDEAGTALDGALRTVASFADPRAAAE